MHTIDNEVAKYLTSLTATNEICSNLGTTLSASTNLFTWVEPIDSVNCITVIPYGGAPPSTDGGNKYESRVQIRIKASTMEVAIKTGQAVIQTLHNNGNVCASVHGVMFALQSDPIFLSYLEDTEYKVVVCNFKVPRTIT